MIQETNASIEFVKPISEFIISTEGLYSFIASLLESWVVKGPRERPDQPGFYYFDRLERAEELALEYVTTTIPPKKAFFKPVETLFRFSLKGPPKIEVEADSAPFILAGVHPCDLAALDFLDIAYSYGHPDAPWLKHRKSALIIGIDCMPDQYCFCTSVGTCLARKPCDIFLTRIERGYFVQVYTQAGEELMEKAEKSDTRSEDIFEVKQRHREKAGRISARLNASSAQIADMLEASDFSEIWHEVAGRCYSCGSCNITCPTCFCFDIHDEFDLSLEGGVRQRSWDSCQLLEFALVAGGHNFRRDRWQRVRHRWHRKFLYLYRQFARPFCTGCGRCSRACTADINIVDVTNQLIAYSRKEGSERG